MTGVRPCALERVLHQSENSIEPTLRSSLRDRTASIHDRLDSALAQAAVGDAEGYAVFLRVQYRARRPIEAWTSRNLSGDEVPPPQSELIARDLTALGHRAPASILFTLPPGADSIGLRWALAGSSLGNRAMLARRRKAGLSGADAFLSDTGMSDYFARLRPLIEQPAGEARTRRAAAGAHAVFAAFLAAIEPVGAAA